MNKHYIRLDKEKRVIKAFSNAFEQPKNNDIFIEDGGRHYNPVIINEDGNFKYKYINKNWIGITYDGTKATEIQNAINYLNETRYVCDNYSDCIYNEDKIRFLAEISDTYNISNSDILKKRREVREELNKMQHEL